MRTKQEILRETLKGIPTPDDIMRAMDIYAEEFAIAKDHWVRKNVDRLARQFPSSDPEFAHKLVKEFKKTLK